MSEWTPGFLERSSLWSATAFFSLAIANAIAATLQIRSTTPTRTASACRCAEDEVAQHQGWLESRRQELAATEAASRVLVETRQAVAATRPPMPMDAAICLAAREKIDSNLRRFLQPGREFGPQLSDWHAENRAVDVFCAYALTTGGKR